MVWGYLFGMFFNVFWMFVFLLKKPDLLPSGVLPPREHHFSRSGPDLEGLGIGQNGEKVTWRGKKHDAKTHMTFQYKNEKVQKSDLNNVSRMPSPSLCFQCLKHKNGRKFRLEK
jgi:hypothetical protein